MLSATGVHVALDDFGTGYSTLRYLQQLSADTLKIDRSFVEHISRSYRDQQIVAAVVAMAHALEMTVIGYVPAIAKAVSKLKQRSTVLDGEIVAVDESGIVTVAVAAVLVPPVPVHVSEYAVVAVNVPVL